MTRRWAAGMVLFALLLASLPARSQAAAPSWQTLGEGITYQVFYLPDPNRVYVARLDRSNPNAILESSLGAGRISGGVGTVSDMAAREDGALNAWGGTWGARNKVVVAINGYFFDTQTGVPWQGQLQSGWYAKRYDDNESGSGIVYKHDRSLMIGGCVVHRLAKQVITFLDGTTMQIDGINVPREEGELILYTPQYDASTLTGPEGVEVLLEVSRPVGIEPAPSDEYGIVRQIAQGQGSSALPFDGVVLSASGETAQILVAHAVLGQAVNISQDVRNFEPDCRTPSPESWAGAYAGIGASFHFLKSGVIQSYADQGALLRNPRTAVAFNQDAIFFIVVDGRDPLHSAGMSIVELASFAKNVLGATDGVALDGGGSSTMVINGRVVNNPNAELQQFHLYLPVSPRTAGRPPSTGYPARSTTPVPAGEISVVVQGAGLEKQERYVANGLLMVVVEPKEQSARFRAGERLRALISLNLRLGPGINYAIRTVIPSGEAGEVLDHANSLNGVLAKGSYWWRVRFGDWEGWAAEENLQAVP